MRLINADAVTTVDYSGLAQIAPNDFEGIAEYFHAQLIINQPTAYDIVKTQQLEQLMSRQIKELKMISLNLQIQVSHMKDAAAVVIIAKKMHDVTKQMEEELKEIMKKEEMLYDKGSGNKSL